MTSITELMGRLRGLDIRLTLDGDRLVVNAPKGALTTELREELSQRRDEVKAFVAARSGCDEAPALAPVARSPEMPVSHTQQRLWFLRQMDPGSSVYNVPTVFRLRGRLDTAALARTMADLVSRHESLRTTFVAVDGVPYCRIQRDAGVALERVDVTDLDAALRERAALEAVEATARKPFDLGRAPLLHATLVKVDGDEHLFALVLDHIVSDGLSLGVLLEDFIALYTRHTGGNAPALPQLPVQYIDYADWERRAFAQGALEEHLTYWKRQLAGLPALVTLPADRPRPPVQTFHGARCVIQLPATLGSALKALARGEGATLFMVLLSAFQALLHRYSGETDVPVGSVVGNRSRSEVQRVIGFFANNIVLRGDLSGDPTVRELIARTRDVALKAFAHQEMPFDILVDAMTTRRALDHSPLFQVNFVLQNLQRLGFEVPGLSFEPIELPVRTARFDMSVDVFDLSMGLRVYCEYNTDLFDAATIERTMSHYRSLLEGFVENPDARIDELPMLSDAERRRLLVEWNATAAQYPREQTVHGLFEAQATRVPEAEAVRFGGQSLSYAQLNERSNRLARHLRELGVGAESLVGVWMERSADMVVALLGILKAGGAYVPLDPAFPKDRIDYMVSDAGLRVVVTQQELAGALDASLVCVRLDADWPQVAQQPGANLPALGGARNLAYVIYTSGSTGRPKGVQLEHRAVVNFLCSMHREPGLREGDRLVSVTTLSFDIAGLEIHGPLTVGATVVLASRADALDGVRLAGLLEDSGATILQATPATWRLLLESGWRGRAGLKMLCGGEAMPRELAQQLLGLGGELWNLYGPTETTIWSTLCRVDDTSRTIPIGRPIANTQVYVLEPSGLPAPIGVAGELCIGGDGLARGYREREELTAEKFVSVALPEVGTARVYRTGDLARYRADGQLEFVGRSDHQVKIRGFRIELGEIESVLATCAGVAQAAVDARVDNTGTAVLAAYVVPMAGQSVSRMELRQDLRRTLPEYMVPQYFVQIQALPLTPNGKLDRKALPAPEDVASGGALAFVEPRNEIEATVAAIFGELLVVERVGAHSDFFDLGGHSLLAVRLMSRLGATFKVELPLQALFKTPTVRDLARRIEQAVSGTMDTGVSGVPATTGTASLASRPIARLPRRAVR